MLEYQRGAPENDISRGGSVIWHLLKDDIKPDRKNAGNSAISILEGGS